MIIYLTFIGPLEDSSIKDCVNWKLVSLTNVTCKLAMCHLRRKSVCFISNWHEIQYTYISRCYAYNSITTRWNSFINLKFQCHGQRFLPPFPALRLFLTPLITLIILLLLVGQLDLFVACLPWSHHDTFLCLPDGGVTFLFPFLLYCTCGVTTFPILVWSRHLTHMLE